MPNLYVGGELQDVSNITGNSVIIRAPVVGSDTTTQTIQAHLGAAATPSITFAGDLDTGMYWSSANVIGWSCAGTVEMLLSGTNLTPGADNGVALGSATVSWADLFLASGGVINWNNGDITITHDANTLAFAGATAAGINGYSFDMAAGAIASEAHGVDITATGTLASGKSLVGLNAAVTAAGTAGAWLSGLFAKATQASKMVNGYLCAAEFELTSTAANASDNSVIVLNSTRNHTGSPPAVDPYITLREYGTTYANALFRVFGDTGQGTLGAVSTTALVSQTTGTFETNVDCAIRCMSGSTAFWLLGSTTQPS